MMSHFEQIRSRLLLCDSRFWFSFRISFEQSGRFPVNEFHHQKFVLAPPSGIPSLRRKDTT